MKFTKETAVEKLTATLGKTQKLSLRTITDIATNAMLMIPEDSEMEIDAFVSKVSPIVKSMNDNLNKEQADFVKEWSEKNPAPTQTTTGQQQQQATTQTESEPPAWYKADMERRQQREAELEAAIKKITGAKHADTVRSSAQARFREKNKDFLAAYPAIAGVLDETIEEISIGESDTEDMVIARLSKDMSRMRKAAGIDEGWTPGGGGGEGGKPVDVSKNAAVIAALGITPKVETKTT